MKYNLENHEEITENKEETKSKDHTVHKIHISHKVHNPETNTSHKEGKTLDINHIIPGTVFEDLNMSHKDFSELPASLQNCKKVVDLNVSYSKIKNFKNCPPVDEIYAIGCKELESLEGCYEGVKKIHLDNPRNLKYIPDYIPDYVIKGISEAKIAECKANWRTMNQESSIGKKLLELVHAFTYMR